MKMTVAHQSFTVNFEKYFQKSHFDLIKCVCSLFESKVATDIIWFELGWCGIAWGEWGNEE